MGEFLDFSYEDFRYKLYIPSNYQPDSEFPLMVLLHGCDQNPNDFAAGTNMNELAEKENFLVLYPDMNHLFNPTNPDSYNPFGCWNWFLDKNQHRGKGHPKLINGIIEEVKGSYSIDSGRVYAAGLSAGASLACILGVTYPDVFSGIGICAGLAYDAANVVFLTDPLAEAAKKSMQQGVTDPYVCGNSAYSEMGEFKKKMPIIVFHGICDTIVHPINGQQVIIQWAQTNFLVEGGSGRTDVTPIEVQSNFINERSYTRHIYADGSGEALMELWMIDEMGHSWSGGSTDGSYTDPLGPNATETIWNFFAKNQHADEKSDVQSDQAANESLLPSQELIYLSSENSVDTPEELPHDTPSQTSEEDIREESEDTDGSTNETAAEENKPDDSLEELLENPPDHSINEHTKQNGLLAFLARLFKKR